MNEPALWLRPKTTRRHLHPPRSERLFSHWIEGKFIFGEVEARRDSWEYHADLINCGVWLLGDGKQFDYKNVKHITTENGAPIHGIVHNWDGISITEEAFCNTVRKSTCFVRIILKNTTNVPVSRVLNMILATGKESEIVFGGADGYSTYSPTIETWRAQKKLWRKEKGVYTDGYRVLSVKTSLSNEWIEKENQINFNVKLMPGEKAVIEFSLDCGEVKEFNYDKEKKLTEAFWEKEMARLNKLPAGIANDPEKLKMVRHLTAQILQCFAYSVGSDYLLPRQGGLMCIIWPTEAYAELEALGKIGNFNEYIEDVISTYFDEMQNEEGEIINIGVEWASVTSSVLYTFAHYCMDSNKEFYYKYRDKAFKALKWIEKTRNSTNNTEGLYGGMFPPLRSNDWEQVFQGNNDPFILMGEKAVVQLTEFMNAPEKDWVIKEYENYLTCVKGHYKNYFDSQKDKDELRIPLCPDGNDAVLVENFYPLLYQGRFVWSGIVEDEKDIRRVYKYMINHGISKDGFYGHMPYPDGNNHIWYMSAPDYFWFLIWDSLGEREKMAQILEHQIKFAMTEEYYMIERYADNDPYFVPWSPNASASGRTILMLLEMNK